jgi:hypothetical protein
MGFIQAQYKYKCHMWDEYQMSNVEYPCEDNSHQDQNGGWILCDYKDSFLAYVKPNGKVTLHSPIQKVMA